MTKDLTKWLAFTLAEVLITIAILGVVAALTIPSLLTKTTEREWNTAAHVFEHDFMDALQKMNQENGLEGYKDTKEFIDELSKYVKISKKCDNAHLEECFIYPKATKEERNTITVNSWGADANISIISMFAGMNCSWEYYNLDLSVTPITFNCDEGEAGYFARTISKYCPNADYTCPGEIEYLADYGSVYGIVLQNGMSVMLSYDGQYGHQANYTNEINIGKDDDCIKFLFYDVNGKNKPNEYGKDIRKFGGAN